MSETISHADTLDDVDWDPPSQDKPVLNIETESNSSAGRDKPNGNTYSTHSNNSGSICYEERLKRIKMQESADHQRKLEKLMQSQKQAEEARKKLEEERKKTIEQNRQKYEERRKLVETRRASQDKLNMEKFDRLLERVTTQTPAGNNPNIMSASCYGNWSSRPHSARTTTSSSPRTDKPAQSIAFGSSTIRQICIGNSAKEVALARQRQIEERLSRFMHSRHRGCFLSSHESDLCYLIERSNNPSTAAAKRTRSKSVHSMHSSTFMKPTKSSAMRSRDRPINSCALLASSDDNSVASNSRMNMKAKPVPIAADSRLVAHTAASKARLRHVSQPNIMAVEIPGPGPIASMMEKSMTRKFSTAAPRRDDVKKPDRNNFTVATRKTTPVARAPVNPKLDEHVTEAIETPKPHSEEPPKEQAEPEQTKSSSMVDSAPKSFAITSKDQEKEAGAVEEDQKQAENSMSSPNSQASVKENREPVPVNSSSINNNAASDNNGPPVQNTAIFKVETNSAGEGGNLSEDAMAIYQATMAEKRRLAREKLELEQKAQKEKEAEEAGKRAELRAEQLRRAQARAEEEARREEERKRAEIEQQERAALERQQAEEEERRIRREKLEAIKRKVRPQADSESGASEPAREESAKLSTSTPPASAVSEQAAQNFKATAGDTSMDNSLSDPAAQSSAQDTSPTSNHNNNGLPKFQSALLQRMLDKGRLGTQSSTDLQKLSVVPD